MNETDSWDTPHCTFTRIAPRLLAQRFKPTMRFLQEALNEVAEFRDRIIGDEDLHALMVVIPEGIPVNADATNVDHFTGERQKRRIMALALVADDPTMRSVSKFYLQWFPQAFPAAVLDDEREALAWLEQQLAQAP